MIFNDDMMTSLPSVYDMGENSAVSMMFSKKDAKVAAKAAKAAEREAKKAAKVAAKAAKAAEREAKKAAKAAAPKRTRATAGAQEKKDIAAIVASIHERTPAGIKIIDSFRSAFGKEILDARMRTGANRSTHYDFEILVDDTWQKVEHKGSAKAIPVNPDDKPWAAGVQFHNGGCDMYTISRAYTRLWYDCYISSGRLSTDWGLKSPIPSYEDWFAKDAKVQDDPKSEFGRELKAAVRAVRGERGSLLELRAEVNAAFNPTADELRIFGEEAHTELNKVLTQKEFWLTLHGDPTGEFYCHWWPQFTLGSVETVTVRKGLDIFFDFRCIDGMTFSCLLRWGKGAGFSNVRLDAR